MDTMDVMNRRRTALEKTLLRQIERLRRRYPEDVCNYLRNRRAEVLAAAMYTWEREYEFEPLKGLRESGVYLFVPVVPISVLGLMPTVEMVQHRGRQGFTRLDPEKFTDSIHVPKTPYFIVGVEEGGNVCCQTPAAAAALISSQGRFPLVTGEILALAIHTDVLSHRYLDAAGSCYGSTCWMPTLVLNEEVPQLDCDPRYDACSCDEWGTPSYSRRV